jgi:hypothetical protein
MGRKLQKVLAEVAKSVQLILKIAGLAAVVILLLLVLSVVTGSPDAANPDASSTTVEVEGLNESVDRFTDPETGATCYVFNDSSISCVTGSVT